MTWDGNESAGVSTAGAFIVVEDDGVERLDLFLAGSLVEATSTALTEGLRTRNDRLGGIMYLQNKILNRQTPKAQMFWTKKCDMTSHY